MGGKRTDICPLQKIFKKIYYAINIQNEGSKLSYIVEILKNLWFDFLLLICMLYSIYSNNTYKYMSSHYEPMNTTNWKGHGAFHP